MYLLRVLCLLGILMLAGWSCSSMDKTQKGALGGGAAGAATGALIGGAAGSAGTGALVGGAAGAAGGALIGNEMEKRDEENRRRYR